MSLLGIGKIRLQVFLATPERGHKANAAVFGHRTCPAFLVNIAPAGKPQHCSAFAVSLGRKEKELHAFL